MKKKLNDEETCVSLCVLTMLLAKSQASRRTLSVATTRNVFSHSTRNFFVEAYVRIVILILI